MYIAIETFSDFVCFLLFIGCVPFVVWWCLQLLGVDHVFYKIFALSARWRDTRRSH